MKYWDIIPHRHCCADCHQLRKWLSQIAGRGGIYNGRAVYIKLDRKQLCRSVMLTEVLDV